MPYMGREISRHNSKVLNKKREQQQHDDEPGCNCTGGPCPLDGKCLIDKVVYRATVKQDDNTTETYTGLTRNSFKSRFYGHRRSFQNNNTNQTAFGFCTDRTLASSLTDHTKTAYKHSQYLSSLLIHFAQILTLAY